MILDVLENAARYESLHPGFAAAFDYLRRHDLAEIPLGRHAIEGDRIFALVSADEPRGAAARLEAHKKYIDVQYVVPGADRIGWSHNAGLKTVVPYDAAKDIEFFVDAQESWLELTPGRFAIFHPTDAHAPLAGAQTARKIVIKVSVES